MTLGSDRNNQIRIKGTKPNHCALLVTQGKVFIKILDPDAVCWINSKPVNSESEFLIGDQLTLSGCNHVTFTLEVFDKTRRRSSNSLPCQNEEPALNLPSLNLTDINSPNPPNPENTEAISATTTSPQDSGKKMDNREPISPIKDTKVCAVKAIEKPDSPKKDNLSSEDIQCDRQKPQKSPKRKQKNIFSEKVSPLKKKKEELRSSSSSLGKRISRKNREEELESPEKIVSRENREEGLQPLENASPQKNTEDFSTLKEFQLQNTKDASILTLQYENDKKLPHISEYLDIITPTRRRTHNTHYNKSYSDDETTLEMESNPIIKNSIKTLQSFTTSIDDGSLSPLLTQYSPSRTTNHKSSDDRSLSSPKLTQYSPPRTAIKSSNQNRSLSPQKQYSSIKSEVSTTRSLIHSEKAYKRRSKSSVSPSFIEATKSKTSRNRDSRTIEKKYLSASSSTEPRKRTNSYKRDSGTKEKKYISSDTSSSMEPRKTNRNKRASGTKEKKYISSDSSSSTESRKTNRNKRDSGTKEKKYISSDSSSSMESRKTSRNKRASDCRTVSSLKRKNSLDYSNNFKKKKLGYPRSHPYIINKNGFISLAYNDQPSLKFSPLSTSKRPKRQPIRYGVILYDIGTIN
jgi:hypothetical protein